MKKLKPYKGQELEKFHGKVLFPEKLKEANKTLAKVGIPKIPK